MSEGSVVEFDHPHMLLQKPDSHLQQLVQQTGPTERQRLESIARASYLRKQHRTLSSGASLQSIELTEGSDPICDTSEPQHLGHDDTGGAGGMEGFAGRDNVKDTADTAEAASDGDGEDDDDDVFPTT